MRFNTRLTLCRKAAFDGGSLLDLACFRWNTHHINSLSRAMVVLGWHSWRTYSSTASITVSANGIEPKASWIWFSALLRACQHNVLSFPDIEPVISAPESAGNPIKALVFSSPRASRMAAKGIFLFLCLLPVTNSGSSGKLPQWPRHRIKISVSAECMSFFFFFFFFFLLGGGGGEGGGGGQHLYDKRQLHEK